MAAARRQDRNASGLKYLTYDAPLLVFDFCTGAGNRRRSVFARPVEVLVARRASEVRPALRAIERAVAAGLYAAGYLAYEAAPAFDPAFVTHTGAGMPLLWFGLFRAPFEWTEPPGGEFQLSGWRADTARDRYAQAIAEVRAAIGRGETYQVNYTIRLRANFAGDALALYRQLSRAQPADYQAYLDIGDYRILSLSPELFFRWNGDQIVARPMKGTGRRGRWGAEDQLLADALAASEKNRAENLMIVDLLRNDIGRVAEIGSVAVPRLFEIERYQTVHQMTSTVTARTRRDTTLEDIFAALFPCGSITGAPKIQTMKLLAGLEDASRGVYCGAIGMLAPNGETVFNVAIRTLAIDVASGAAEYGVGGGITWDSTAEEEYDEALLKAALLTEPWPAFDLIETLRLEDGTYALLERHLDRLKASAHYFGLPLAEETIRKQLDEHACMFASEARRVRLLVSQNGDARVESQALAASHANPQPVGFARTPISRQDRFLFHKTTQRAVYDARRAERPEVFDVLLWNEEGEVTEFTIGNLVIELDGRRLTPPLDSGLLAGVFRAELLARGEIQECVLYRANVEQAARCWLINSVRAWVPVVFVGG